MAVRKVTIPAANEPVILPNGTMNPNWFLYFKFIETLQPLSDIPAPTLPAPVTPGSTSASVVSFNKGQSTSPAGGVVTTLIYSASSPNFNQELANDMATIADALTKASVNDSNLATAVSTLSTRLNTLETKFNDVLTALS